MKSSKGHPTLLEEISCSCLIFIVFLVMTSPMAYLAIDGYMFSCGGYRNSTSAPELTTKCILLEVRRVPHVIDESGCYIVRNQLASLQYGTAALEIAAGVTAEIEFEDGNDIIVGRGAIGVLVHSAATAHIHNLYCNGFSHNGGICVGAYNASIEMSNTGMRYVRCGILQEIGRFSAKNMHSITVQDEVSYFHVQLTPDISHDVIYTMCLDSVVSYPECELLLPEERFYNQFVDEDGFICTIPWRCKVLACCDDRPLPIFPDSYELLIINNTVIPQINKNF